MSRCLISVLSALLIVAVQLRAAEPPVKIPSLETVLAGLRTEHPRLLATALGPPFPLRFRGTRQFVCLPRATVGAPCGPQRERPCVGIDRHIGEQQSALVWMFMAVLAQDRDRANPLSQPHRRIDPPRGVEQPRGLPVAAAPVPSGAGFRTNAY